LWGVLGVCVLAGNKAGMRFYERRGARRTSERVSYRIDDEPVVDILYRFDDLTRFLISGRRQSPRSTERRLRRCPGCSRLRYGTPAIGLTPAIG
jgi:hypothetical protein